MDYQVSARKYRPRTFDDVIGQPHVVQTLMNSIATKRIAHAFLFSGTRGVGKTTIARILAKALNCEQGPTGTPCSSCANCLEITQGTSVDVIEIDGASNTSVDDVREIRENVRFTPFRGQYRVYMRRAFPTRPRRRHTIGQSRGRWATGSTAGCRFLRLTDRDCLYRSFRREL